MADSRERILTAAEARLLSLGPSGLVLNAVAADADISRGGLLYHFASKEALVAGHARPAQDGIDPKTAIKVRLAADGLWLSALMGLPQLDPTSGAEVIRALRDLTHG